MPALLIKHLVQNNGVLDCSQRTIANDIGVSASRVNTLLRDLARSGHIEVLAGTRSTLVRLAA